MCNKGDEEHQQRAGAGWRTKGDASVRRVRKKQREGASATTRIRHSTTVGPAVFAHADNSRDTLEESSFDEVKRF